MDDLKDKFPNIPESIARLGELSFNLWWSWHPAARMLFKMLDRQAWKDAFYNPVKLLKVLPPEILAAAARDPEYQQHYETVHAKFHADMKTKRCWFEENKTCFIFLSLIQ